MAKTPAELGKLKKKEYPGEYDDFDDDELGNIFIEDNPGVYDKYLGVSNKPTPRSLVSKTIGGAERALAVASDPTARYLLGPAARQLPISEEAKMKIRQIETGEDVAYGSNIVESVLPGIFEHVEGAPAAFNIGKTASRVAVDVATDPLSYVGLGLATKSGKLLRSVKEAIQAGQNIPLTSPIAMQIAKVEGVSKPTVALINKYKRLAKKSGGTFSQQISKGERSLLALTDPLNLKSTGIEFTGKAAGAIVKPLSLARRGAIGAKIESGVRELASTKTGHEDYDLIRANYKDLTEYRIGIKLEDAKKMNAQMKDLSRLTGKPREVLSKEISSLVERVKPKYLDTAKDYRSALIVNGKRYIGSPGDTHLDVITGNKELEPIANELYGHNFYGKPTVKQEAGFVNIVTGEFNSFKQIKEKFGVDESINLSNKSNKISKLQKRTYSKDALEQIELSLTDRLVDAQVALKNAHRVGDQKLVSQFAKDVVEINSTLNTFTGKYKPPPSVNPEIDAVVNQLREGYARQLLDEQASGRKAVPLLADIEYLTHAMIPEARKAIVDKMVLEGRLPPTLTQKELSDKLANEMHRQFAEVKPLVVNAWKDAGIVTGKQAKAIKGKEGLKRLWDMLDEGLITADQYTDVVHTLPIEEVHKLNASGKLKNMFGEYAGEVFHTDPVYTSAVRGIRGEIARTATEFFNELKARGVALPEGSAPAGWVKVRQPALEGHLVPRDIAKSVDAWNRFETQSGVMAQVLKSYDQFHNLTKLWTLAPFPAYHTLNAVGNFWNNFLSGLTNPDMYRQALMTQVNKADPKYRPVKFTDVFGNKWNTEKLVDEGRKHGVIGKGQYGAEVQKTIQQELESGKFLTLSSRSHFLRVGLRAGKFIEDNARMAHFINRLRQGDTAEQAALSVKKYLFDYGELSDFERKVLNRGFFFYTWTRKNIPLQMHSLVSTPAKFSLPFKAKHEIEKTVPEANEKYMAEWMKENFPIRIRFDSKAKNYEYFMLNRWLPAADLLKVAHLHEIALQMLAPIPKEILQQIANRDFYFKQPVEAFKGERKKFLGKDLPARLVHGAKLVRLLNEVDKLTKEDATTYSKMMGILTGKNYTFDPNQALLSNKKRVDEDINVLRSALYRAASQGNNSEVSRITALIQEKTKEY